MQIKNHIKDYLSFSRRDRLGIAAFLLLILIIYLLPVLFGNEKTVQLVRKDLEIAWDSLNSRQLREQGNRNRNYPGHESQEYSRSGFTQAYPEKGVSFENAELFSFDPNTLSVEGWQKLGLSEKTSLMIEKFRSKGGKFYKPEDLQKIWGLPRGFYERVRDHIIINQPGKSDYATKFGKEGFREKKPGPVDINDSDTAALIALPGIGTKLASRIVGFRNRLGGFYSVDQVKETYGLPDSVFQKIKPYLHVSGQVKKINVNTATKDELKAHPYIKWNMANAIVEYRNQHGVFGSLEELLKIAVIDEKVFERMRAYLVL